MEPTPLILVCSRQRQAHLGEFNVRLFYINISRPTRTTSETVSKNRNKTKTIHFVYYPILYKIQLSNNTQK